MAASPRFDRRFLLRSGLTVSAVGAAGVLGLPGAATAAGTRQGAEEPEIFGTQDWGARPPSEPVVVENHKPTYIVVHHTVDPGNSDDFSKDRAFSISRTIQDHHMDVRGWIDSGQQFTNSRGGYITEGRHRSLEILREGTRHVQGTNVAGNNSQVIGIENEGLYTEVDVPDTLWDSLVALVAYIASQYGIGMEFIKGHRDFNTTECPGARLYARLPELRTTVAQRLGVEFEQPVEWPLLKPGDSGERVAIAQRLLRDRGARNVPVDGIYGPSTKQAVAAFVAERGVQPHHCHATTCTDETGWLGSDLWPLLVAHGNDRSSRSWKEQLARAS
jgi:hypothetical protein